MPPSIHKQRPVTHLAASLTLDNTRFLWLYRSSFINLYKFEVATTFDPEFMMSATSVSRMIANEPAHRHRVKDNRFTVFLSWFSFKFLLVVNKIFEPLGRNCRRTLLTQLTDRF